eukprot:3565-Eustigmatos_ZCMA.PRE.1
MGVGLLDGIEHRPEDVELELQDVQRTLLLLWRAEGVERHAQAVLDIARGQWNARAEIRQPFRLHPRIVLWPAGK